MAGIRGRTRVSTSHSSNDPVDDPKAVVVQLRFELETERKCIRRLRREKAYEVLLAREQEQHKAAILVKETAAKLHQAKEQETEVLRCRYKADIDKVTKQKVKEVNKIKKDLVKCQADLKEEVCRRGLSASARAAFELERSKLLQEIKELSFSKRQTEDALCSATEAEKQRSLELRLLQESTQKEILKINREANVEMKRLLEELKAKDQTGKRNHSGIRFSPKGLQESKTGPSSELIGSSKEIESWENKLSTIKDVAEAIASKGNISDFSLQRKLYDIEKQLKFIISVSSSYTERNNELTSANAVLEQKLGSLMEENKSLNVEVKSARGEMKRLKDLMNSTGISNLTLTLEDLHKQIKDYEKKANSEKKPKLKKTVRFLLPDVAGEVSSGGDGDCAMYDDGGGGVNKGGGREGSNQPELQQLTEATVSGGVSSQHEDWQVQKESLKVVIEALEEKLKNCQDNEDELKLKLQEVCDQNEELEFQILELENGTDEKKLQCHKENEMLRLELSVLRDRLMNDESSGATERSVATQCNEEMLAFGLSKTPDAIHESANENKLSSGLKVEKKFAGSGCSASRWSTNIGQINEAADAEALRDFAGERKLNVKVESAAASDCVGFRDSNVTCTMTHTCCRDTDMEWTSQMEKLKRKLLSSQTRERHMKDQLMLLEEEKNRQINLLQQQVESLEGSDTHPPTVSDKPTSQETRETNGERLDPEGLEHEDHHGNRDNNNGRGARTVTLQLDTTLNWVSSPLDVVCLTPASDVYSSCPNFEYKAMREEQLCRQVSDLERDRDVLQELIHNNDSIIFELRMEICNLQRSERDLQRIVERLKNAEEEMHRKADYVAGQKEDMENQMKELKESENLILANFKKCRSAELELKLRVEELVEEKRACEMAWKRRYSEVEMEKRLLQGKVTELEDQVGDIESAEIFLRQKLKRMERAKIHLQNELENAKQECSRATAGMSELELEKEILVQKLEKVNVDHAAETVHLRQEKEAMEVELVELNCAVKVLEHSLASRELTVLSLETRLHEAEWHEAMLMKNVHGQAGAMKQKDRKKEIHFGFDVKPESSRFDDFVDARRDGCCRVPEKKCSLSVTDNHLICNDDDEMDDGETDDDKAADDLSKKSFSLMSSFPVSFGEVESADEASEITDEDDGAIFISEGSTIRCWNPDSGSSSNHLSRLTKSSSLESVYDSGLESLKHGDDRELNGTKSRVPASPRYFTSTKKFLSSDLQKNSTVPIVTAEAVEQSL